MPDCPHEADADGMLQERTVTHEIDAQAVRDLEAHVLGEVIRPGDAEYHAARSVWNTSVERFPQLIVRAADAADVIRAVEFARTHQLTLAVRSGGHSFAGYGTSDGMVLDMSRFQSRRSHSDWRCRRATRSA
jgi:FAD/FMN-containing dehydrogenase